jgi:hypothetical protein
MKMRICFTLLVLANSLIDAKLRDPFSYGGTFHHLACVGIGCINNELFCARLYDDGLFTMLKLHDSYGTQDVVRISSSGITFRQTNGLEHHIVLEFLERNLYQKSPST